MAPISTPASRAALLRREIFELTEEAREVRRERSIVAARVEADRQSRRADQQSQQTQVDNIPMTDPEYARHNKEYSQLMGMKKEAIELLEDEVLHELKRKNGGSKASCNEESKQVSKRKIDKIVAKGVLRGVKKLHKD